MNNHNYLWPIVVLSTIYSSTTHADVKQEIEALKSQILILKQKVVALENKVVSNKNEKLQEQQTREENQVVSISTAPKIKQDVKLYATLRPTFGYIEEHGENSTDVRDALSHAGFKSTTEFNENWKAILHAEWGIDLSNNGDFGKARQVYVALDSPLGRIGIGKQRPAQYLFIAEYVDLFNHSSSPFAYDPESLFFVNNLLTYQKSFGDFTFIAVGQYNGDDGDNYQDLLNTGVSYDHNGLHLALTYTTQDALNTTEVIGNDDIIGASFAYQFTPELYIALGYQDKEYKRSYSNTRNGHTFDASLAYILNERYKMKLGYFDFEDGFNRLESKNYNGYNATFEWLPYDNLRFHIEYLKRNFKYQHDFQSLSFGFRYDYSQLWQY